MPEFSPWHDNSLTSNSPVNDPLPYKRISEDAEFHSLRRAQRRFGVRATILSVGGFLLYVLLSHAAPGLMNQRLTGHLTLGLALGLGQFVVMGVTAWCYVRHMRTRVDPLARGLASRLRQQELDHPAPQRPTARPGAPHVVTVSAGIVDRFSLNLTFVLFLTVVVVTLFMALLTAPQRDEISEFYLGNRTMSPLRNGLAMCGDYVSAATLLGSTGLVALNGYDGLLYLGGTVVAWMMVLLLIAEPCVARASSPWVTRWPCGCPGCNARSGSPSRCAPSPSRRSTWLPNSWAASPC